jgi:hypothetical protein
MSSRVVVSQRRGSITDGDGLAEFGPVGEVETWAEITEGTVAGDEGEAARESVGGNEHVHSRETFAPLPRKCGEAGIGLGSGRIPR